MTAANNHAAAEAAIGCGACGANNSPDAKFCKGCGQSLTEPCSSCGKSVHLTQRFCGSCGADLQEEVTKIHQQHEAWNRAAVAAAKECDFDHAIGLLQRMSELTDYRYKEAANAAANAVEKIEKMRDRAFESAEQAIAQAEVEREQGNHEEVIRLLKQVPQKLLSPEAKASLASAESYLSEVTVLDDSLRKGITERDWALVGSLLNQLLVMVPDDPKYQKLSQQVASKLIAKSKKRFERGYYSRALEQLAAIPNAEITDQISSLKQTYEDAEWLSRQSDHEPFATPLLGRLAVRYAKQIPGDKKAMQQATALAARLKQRREDPRHPFPQWTAPTECWIGGKVRLLDRPRSLPLREPNLLKPCVGGYHVAIGLALQGLGKARVTESFSPKKSFLSSAFGRRSADTCWGVDIGASCLKAVQLAQGDDGVEIVDAYYEEFKEPVSSDRQADDQQPAAFETAVGNLIKEKDLGDTPVWANVSSSDFINRFRRLPPFPDKKAYATLENELQHEMPIPMEDVFAVRWIGPLDTSHARGRPAVVSASKRSIVEDRLEALAENGLNIAGLQTDTIALVNFAAYEFADELQVDQDDDSSAAEQDGATQSADENPDLEDGRLPTVAIVDCGAATTSLILISGETHWYRTVASGGEDLTTALSRSTQSARAKAEQLKRNPAAIEFPSKQYLMVEQRLDSIRKRLEWMLNEALKEDASFEIVDSWCVGGGFLAHQAIRRLMLTRSTEEEAL